MNSLKVKQPVFRKAQKGAVTMFSAVLILILLTEMVIYALQVGVFEQRKSSNEVRQKQAFHLADSAVQHAKQYLATNALYAASSRTAGWLESGSERWKSCAGFTGTGSHPCYGEPDAALRAQSFYLVMDPTDTSTYDITITNNASPVGANQDVSMHALLCMLEFNADRTVKGCTSDPLVMDDKYFMITLLARGQADCETDNNGNPADCKAQALIVDKIASTGPAGGEGGPGAPLTARTNVPLSGTVEIVPNPNGGGVGVPISSWVNTNDACPPPGGIDPVSPISGSYATCERHEWYGMDKYPDDYMCPTATCSCSSTEDKLISYVEQGVRQLGIDIVPDDDFPCDLFLYSFGYTKLNYEKVKELVPPSNRLSDCSSLDENSSGMYWISGSTCNLNGQVGTADYPVYLISAAADTRVNAGAELFGVLFVTDVEHLDTGVEFSGNGNATIYGAAVMDGSMEHFNGTFQIVYLENVLDNVLQKGAFGSVSGGWTDFHTAWQ